MLVWYGVNRMIIHFFKASIWPSSLYSIHPSKSSWWKIASMSRNLINSVPKTSSDDLCLHFCLYPSSMYSIYNTVYAYAQYAEHFTGKKKKHFLYLRKHADRKFLKTGPTLCTEILTVLHSERLRLLLDQLYRCQI